MPPEISNVNPQGLPPLAVAGQPWQTPADCRRIAATAANRRLFEGRHREHFYERNNTQHVFKAVGPNASKVLYLADNLAGQATLKHGDLLFGEELAIAPADGAADSPAMASAINRFAVASKLHPMLYEAAVTAGWAGRAWWQFVVQGGQVRAQNVPPEHVFPRYAAGASDLVGATIKYPITLADRSKRQKCLRIIDHALGQVRNELWELDAGGRVVRQASLDLLGGDISPVQPTGIDRLTIVCVENFTTGGRGASDYDGAESLIDEINNRLTQISRILDQHGDPVVQALESLFDENGELKISGRAIRVDSLKDGDAVRYVTWNAQLEHAAVELDRAMRAFLRHMEVAPSLVGLGDSASSADSWKKFKLQISTTLARVNRKQLFMAPAIHELFAVAFGLENRFALGIRYAPGPVSLTWSDGLPVDDQDLQTIVTGYYREGLMSRRMALTWMHGDPRIVAEEIEQLDAEAEARLPAGFGGGAMDLPDEDGGAADAPPPMIRELTGVQIASATGIVAKVAAGEVPRESGVAMLVNLLGMTRQQAEDMIGDAGTRTPVTANPGVTA
jgi:hypothetical protein